MKVDSKNLKVAIFFGGPSNECDISLDSARSLYDTIRIQMNEDNINLYYVTIECEFIQIGFEYIYSNKLADFLFKLEKSPKIDIKKIVANNHIFCPMIHGTFGEDGKLTRMLEISGVKSILGSKSTALKLTLDKHKTQNQLELNGYNVAKRVFFTKDEWESGEKKVLDRINQAELCKHDRRIIIKPNDGGSSDGVFLSTIPELSLFVPKVSKISENILVEEFIVGQEFSIIVLQDKKSQVLPLYPTGVFKELDINGNPTIYSRTHKYMPGTGAKHKTPFVNDDFLIEIIREQAKSVFNHLELSDWARLDGFVTTSGDIIWSDINGIPGYGQDSFFFQQSTIFSLSHASASRLLLDRTAKKGGIDIEWEDKEIEEASQKTVAVLGGGRTSEKNVSRMSWTNVIQKLNYLQKYSLKFIFQDTVGDFWDVPYFLTLQHTIEEIEDLIKEPELYLDYYQKAITVLRSFDIDGINESLNFKPEKIDLFRIPNLEFVFIALHGGEGENGTLQSRLRKHGIFYNGCDSEVSKICMNKSLTNQKLIDFGIDGFHSPKQYILDSELFKKFLSKSEFSHLIDLVDHSINVESLRSDSVFQLFKKNCRKSIAEIQSLLSSPKGLVFKPMDDGCSSGVVLSVSPFEALPIYVLLSWSKRSTIPLSFFYKDKKLSDQNVLNMPTTIMRKILIEQLFEVNKKSNIIELTVGVVGHKGKMKSLLPSETIAEENAPLGIIEKFLKGGGVNFTPSPNLKVGHIRDIQDKISTYSNKLGIEGYARLDVFFDCENNDLYLIEVNSLPGLTPATIIYTQALLSKCLKLKPSEFLDHLISLGFES